MVSLIINMHLMFCIMFVFQSAPHTTFRQTVDELNRCAMEQGELRCPEYSFKMAMNPWQHPVLDKNIHHLLTLVTTLCNTCGGVIFLTTDDPEEHVTMEVTERFQSRITELVIKNTGIQERKINFTKVPFCIDGQIPWTAIHLKRSDMTTCLNYGIDSNLHEVRTDLNGFIKTEKTEKSEHSHVKQNPSARVSSHAVPDAGEHVEETTKCDHYGLHASAERRSSAPEPKDWVTSPSSNDDTNIPVDFSIFNKLEWSKNKKDWESYVHGETPTIETIVNSCSLWKPTTPMTVTPDRKILEYWFASAEDMEKTLSEVATRELGFAVICKTWKFHTSNSETGLRPPGHICDIVTVSSNGKIHLWVICSSHHDEQSVSYQMEYLLTTGRMIKYCIVQGAGHEDLSNVFIECHLFCPNTQEQMRCEVSTTVKETLQMQKCIGDICKDGLTFENLQKAFASVLLSKDSPLKRPFGNQTAITLSTQQVAVLSSKDRVNYVCGPMGSGKSYTAALLCQMHGRDKCVYICTTMEFVAYLRFSGYEGTLIQRDQDLVTEIKDGTFKNKTHIIIDDSHNFSCTKSSMKKLFKLMYYNKEISLYVFADNDYQSFDEKRKQAMRNCIRELSLKVLGKEPHYTYFTAIYRNTKKMVSFIQSAIQDSYEGYQEIECQNMETGDGIECIKLTNIWMHFGENDLAYYLHTTWTAGRYKMTETAILLDPSYTEDEVDEYRIILREHLPNSDPQRAGVFPRRGVVVDSVSSFLGLDAPLCVFILPCIYSPQKTKPSFFQKLLLLKRGGTETDLSICNPHVKVFMASRATHKAVFIVPKMNAEIAKVLTFDLFEVGGAFTMKTISL